MNPVFEMAKKYYPRLWNEDRIAELHRVGRLSDKEVKEITGKSPEREK